MWRSQPYVPCYFLGTPIEHVSRQYPFDQRHLPLGPGQAVQLLESPGQQRQCSLVFLLFDLCERFGRSFPGLIGCWCVRARKSIQSPVFKAKGHGVSEHACARRLMLLLKTCRSMRVSVIAAGFSGFTQKHGHKWVTTLPWLLIWFSVENRWKQRWILLAKDFDVL